MKDIKIGQVVKTNTGFYIVESGGGLGKFKLTPIVIDPTRNSMDLTPEIDLVPYGYH